MEPSTTPAHQPAQGARSCADALADYPEFRAPGGSRYLKKLLRQILPMALYRTWEIFTDHQARGNDCYLSISQLAALAGRSVRTMQKSVASLQTRHLLVERVERKSFRNADGRTVSRFVIVKDFTALYALAHDYHEWLQSEEMIPPQRIFISLLIQDAALVTKLRRFDNYRRLLLHHMSIQPASEENYGLTDNAPVNEQREPPLQATILASKEMSKQVSKRTPKRINTTSHRDVLQGDSFDSASPSPVSLMKRRNQDPQGSYSCGSSQEAPEQPPQRVSQQQATLARSIKQERTIPHHPMPPNAPGPIPRKERKATVCATHHPASHPRENQVVERSVVCQQSPEQSLVRSFLHAIAVPFGDQNPKGSITRLLKRVAQTSLKEAEVMQCLVQAYTIARDTQTIRECYVNSSTGQANRMPLFCSLVERFMQTRRRQDAWSSSWQQMEEAIVADNWLHTWWTKHQTFLIEGPLSDPLHDPPPVPPQPQNDAEKAPPSPVGWARREAAQAWGERLLDALMTSGYEAEVHLRQISQWYQLALIGEDCSLAIETPAQAQIVLEQFQKEDMLTEQGLLGHEQSYSRALLFPAESLRDS